MADGIPLATVLVPTCVAVAGWVAAHLFTRNRDRVNKRRDQRVQYLIDAYRRLERAGNRDLDEAPRYYVDIESAVADIQLFGSPTQVENAREFAKTFARERSASLQVLLEGLRADLRAELGLGAVPHGLTHLRIFVPPERLASTGDGNLRPGRPSRDAV